MGLRASADQARHDWANPVEDLEEGCPASWYHSIFACSLDKYIPTSTPNGWMESPLLTREAPRLVHEAMQLYKRDAARCEALGFEVMRG